MTAILPPRFSVLRDTFTDVSTIGTFSFDGNPLCDTLEDPVREGPDGILQPSEKVVGQTAIPHGTYELVLHFWPKFERSMPMLLDVPLYSGVFIHPGNWSKDTLGCILVGNRNAKFANYIGESKLTFYLKVLPAIEEALRQGRTFISVGKVA